MLKDVLGKVVILCFVYNGKKGIATMVLPSPHIFPEMTNVCKPVSLPGTDVMIF
jgi:hypothetical protein